MVPPITITLYICKALLCFLQYLLSPQFTSISCISPPPLLLLITNIITSYLDSALQEDVKITCVQMLQTTPFACMYPLLSMVRPITITITSTLYWLLFLLSSLGLPRTSDSCTIGDADALLRFMNAVNITSLKKGWGLSNSNGSCCDWEGVICDATSAQIVGISLSSKGLYGRLSQGLANIPSLQVLDVSNNDLYGPLPQDLSTLSSLHTLDVSSNNFSGQLSDVLVNFSSLQVLNLSTNAFNGSLPSSSLRNLSLLRKFLASNNDLSGDLPLVLCQTAPLLQEMDLSSNNFSGTISKGIGLCGSLQVLDLGYNNLVGNLPQDLYNLTSLVMLHLTTNHFDGEVDNAIGNLINLSHLMLGSNNFTGQLPSNLSSCTNLKVFTANANKFNGSLDVLRFNQFPMLENLDLNSNAFVGSIPSPLTECATLKSINLAHNKLSGEVPSSLYRLKNLTTLILSSNNLNGSITSLDGSEHLVIVILSKNVFNEALPDRMQGVTNLQVFAVGDIRLFGSIPEWLRNCTKLQVLDLSWNNLTGSIPPWIGSFPHLFYLDLSHNSFFGSIPPELFLLHVLIHLDNNLTGLQGVVSNLAIKQELDVQELQYTQVSAFPPSIYLSHNRLQGSIPSQVGAFILILDMDLSFNNLSGNIPEIVANMIRSTILQLLDLSRNSLNSLDLSLMKLTNLGQFSVSYNQLEGLIPLGNRFSTFSSESYEGNPRLCGAPLPFPCENDVNPNSSSSKIESLIIATDILEPIGVVIGYVGVLVGWLTWKLTRRKIG